MHRYQPFGFVRKVSYVKLGPVDASHKYDIEDEVFGVAARYRAENTFAARKNNGGPPYEFILYKVCRTLRNSCLWLNFYHQGTTHGFAARPALEYPEVKDAFEKSFAKTIEFLGKIVNTVNRDDDEVKIYSNCASTTNLCSY